MKKIFLPAFLALTCLVHGAFAEAVVYPEGAEGGRQLAADQRARQPQENTKTTGTLNVLPHRKPVRSLPVTCETIVGKTNWTMIYSIGDTGGAPVEKLTVIHTPEAPNQYIYSRATASGLPAVEAKTNLTGAEADIPLGGSDFWLSDLGFEFFHWPDQNLLKGVMRNGKPCYVLESTNPHPGPNSYWRITTTIEKESGVIFEAEALGMDKKVLKEFALGSAVEVDKKWQLKEMKISNEKTGSRTRIEYNVEK